MEPIQDLNQPTHPTTTENNTPQKELKNPYHRTRNALYVVLFIVVALLITYVVVSILNYHQSKQKSETISIVTTPINASVTPNGFDPNTVSIRLGQTIVWTNYDTKGHDIVSTPNKLDPILVGFKSPVMLQNQTYSFVFDKTGTFTYHDSLNPNFSGTVVVH